MRRPASSIVVLLALAVFGGRPALAQQETCLETIPDGGSELIGCVDRLSQKKLLFFRRTVDESNRIEIRPPNAAPIRPVRTGMEVATGYNVELMRPAYVELHLKHGINESAVTLAGRGVWSIDRDEVLQLAAIEGEGLIQQIQGRLQVYVRNTLIVIHGTTVYLDVDPATDVDYVFVREGRISFPELDQEVEGTDLLWALREGFVPMQASVASATMEAWRGKTERAARGVWQAGRSPILQRPAFWLLAAGVAGFVALVDCGVTNFVCPDGGPGTSRGTIRIPIPD